MKSILIDMGNTFCKVALSEKREISVVHRFKRDELLNGIIGILPDDLSSHFDKCVISSVSGGYDEIEEYFEQKGVKVIALSSKIPLPIKIDYSTPETLGADRIAAAIGAHSLFPGEECIVFDLGSAITIDFVESDGTFKGGNISPGMAMRFKAMHQFTNKLPLVSPTEVKQLNGQSTLEAINNGVVLGIVFEIERYIERFPSRKIIFTGGDSIFFAKILKSTIFAVCNLVLIGLSNIGSDE